MELFYLKKYLNKKVYLLAKLKLSKSMAKPEQITVDDIVENFSENESTFSNLEAAQEFLNNNKKSVVVDASKLEKFKNLKKSKPRKKRSIFPLIVLILILLLGGFVLISKFR